MLTFYEWKSRGSVTQLLGQAILILIFCSLGSKNRTHCDHVFCIYFFARIFFCKTSTNSASEQNSEPKKVYAHDALTNAYFQCVENKLPVRKAAKLHNIPHTTLKDRLSGRVHIDTCFYTLNQFFFPKLCIL